MRLPEEAAALLPPDHPQRRQLAHEVHARPPEAIETPTRASHIALIVEPEQRTAELAHLAALCAGAAAPRPAPDANHYVVDIGQVRVRWERHGEFSTYTFFVRGQSPKPYSEPATSLLPAGWIAALTGQTIFAGHAKLVRGADIDPDPEYLAEHFGANVVVGARIGGGAGWAYSDFVIHEDGFSRFLIVNRLLSPRQAGRTVQRLFEIETYRMMAMCALPIAREQSLRAVRIEHALAALTEDIARHTVPDESLLNQLSSLAAEVESCLAASQFRFGACRAYHELVNRRIRELREERVLGIQTIEDFMARRFSPAVATCASTSQRLRDLSERVAQASALLSTRVDIAREQQNHLLLDSMNRRAKLQLRLQATVEVISVVPITYYLVGLLGYVSKALKAAALPLDPEVAEGAAVPIVALLVILVIRAAHRRALHK